MLLKKLLVRWLGSRELEESGIAKIVYELIPKMAAVSAVCLIISLLISRDIRDIPGFVTGFLYAVFSLVYLARTCTDAALCKDTKKAKDKMMRCYILRFAGLFALGAVSLYTGLFSFAGVLIPQLLPKILLSAGQFSRKKD